MKLNKNFSDSVSDILLFLSIVACFCGMIVFKRPMIFLEPIFKLSLTNSKSSLNLAFTISFYPAMPLFNYY